MYLKLFFEPTKLKLIYLLIVGAIILVSGIMSENVIYCFTTPCDQPPSTLASQQIYSVASFNFQYINPGISYLNNQIAVGIKNFLQPLPAGTTYLIISLVTGLIIHYIIICVIAEFLHRYKPGIVSKRKK